MRARTTTTTALALLALAPLGACTKYRATRPWTGQPEVVAEFDRQITGVALSPNGRMFVNHPNWREPHTVSVVEVLPDGSTRPFPNEAWNTPDATNPGETFVCVQSVVADRRDYLWILDPASPRFSGVVPGGAKLVRVNLADGQVVSVFRFDESIAPTDSYLNDVRIDTDRGFAYITDSGRPGLVVLNFHDGTARRVLDGHPAVSADPFVNLTADGEPLVRNGEPMTVHADGIALSRDGNALFWQALTGRTLYAIDTAVLRDDSADDERIAGAVRIVAPTSASDGMEIDRFGNVYLTDFEHDAIQVFNTGFDNTSSILVRSDLLVWPDALAWGPRGDLYVSTSQIHRTDAFSPDGSMPSTPYRVLKLHLNQRIDPLWDVRTPRNPTE